MICIDEKNTISYAKHIYVIQMHTGTIPGKVIKLLTRYEYSHVAIALDKDCKTTYSFGRKDLRNFLNSGFVVEQQDGEFFNKFCRTKCRIYEIEVSENQHRYFESLLGFRTKHKNFYKYDFAGIILRFFGIPLVFGNRRVCSQFVAETLEQGDIISFSKPVCFVKPRDFENHRGFKTIYEGLYSEYHAA